MNGLPPLLASNDEARALVKFWLRFSPPSVALGSTGYQHGQREAYGVGITETATAREKGRERLCRARCLTCWQNKGEWDTAREMGEAESERQKGSERVKEGEKKRRNGKWYPEKLGRQGKAKECE